MKRTFRPISAILLTSILLTACGAGGDVSDDTTSIVTTPDEGTEKVPQSKYEAAVSSLPEGLRFDGETVNLLISETGEQYTREIGEEATGDVVNDATYARNLAVKERLGIDISINKIEDHYGNDIGKALQTQVMAGDNSYDMAMMPMYYGTKFALSGVFYNIRELKYVDLDAQWYSKDFIETATVYGNLFFLSGDLSLTDTSQSNCVFFNKKLLESNMQGVDPYAIVKDGEWTWERFGQLVADTYRDLNGDTKRDENDFYGYATAIVSVPVDGILSTAGIDIVSKNSDGELELTLNNAKTINIYDITKKLYTENNGVLALPRSGDNKKLANTMFKESRSVFYMQAMSFADELRDFNDPYGILPMPKYDKAQEEYKTVSEDGMSLITVPTNCEKLDLVGAFIDEMSFRSYQLVTPAYYEVALKTKYLSGAEDAEMYDLIVHGKKCDLGMIFSESLDNIFWTGCNVIGGTQNFSSYYASIESAVKAKLDTLNKSLMELAG